MLLSELARLINGEVEGQNGDVEISGVAKIEDAPEGTVTFLSNPKYAKFLSSTRASAVLVAKSIPLAELAQRAKHVCLVRVNDPYLTFLQLIDHFHPAATRLPKGIHPTAIIAPSSRVHPDAAIGPLVVIGDQCSVGANTQIHAGVVIGENSQVGDDCIIYSNVSIREAIKIGRRVIIHSGTVIGSDGFGFAPKPDGTYEKIPQRGIVTIEDDVEIGANCAIDRSTLGTTLISRGAKLDNLIHVAHNVTIGENTVIAAQAGISGSTRIGKNCMIGGQVGFVGHIEIADRTNIGAQSGVPKSITKSGQTFFGYPAREIKKTLRIEGALSQLPDLLHEFQSLRMKVRELEEQLQSVTKRNHSIEE